VLGWAGLEEGLDLWAKPAWARLALFLGWPKRGAAYGR
jgi:hypothetical protein